MLSEKYKGKISDCVLLYFNVGKMSKLPVFYLNKCHICAY